MTRRRQAYDLWAASHPAEAAVLRSYWDSPDPAQRELADMLTGQDRASIHLERDVPWDLVTAVLRHLKPAEKDRGAKRDQHLTKLEARARANLTNPTDTALFDEMARLDPRYSSESIRVMFYKRKRTDRLRAVKDGWLGQGEFE